MEFWIESGMRTGFKGDPQKEYFTVLDKSEIVRIVLIDTEILLCKTEYKIKKYRLILKKVERRSEKFKQRIKIKETDECFDTLLWIGLYEKNSRVFEYNTSYKGQIKLRKLINEIKWHDF